MRFCNFARLFCFYTNKEEEEEYMEEILNPQKMLIKAIKKNDIKTLKMILKSKNINLNLKSKRDRTALDTACRKGNIEIVKLLLNTKKITYNPNTVHYCKDIEIKELVQNYFDFLNIINKYEETDMYTTNIISNDLLKCTFKEPPIDIKNINWSDYEDKFLQERIIGGRSAPINIKDYNNENSNITYGNVGNGMF